MRGLLCSLVVPIALTSLGALAAGCGNDEKQPLPHYKDSNVKSDDIETSVPRPHLPLAARAPALTVAPQRVQEPGPTDNRPAFRDYAAYSYRDRAGAQWFSQAVLDRTGETYWERFCPVDGRDGPSWGACDAWSGPHAVADLGAGVGQLSGINGVVFEKAGVQLLAQTAFTDPGDMRIGRVCPIGDKRPDWKACSGWEELELASSAFGIFGNVQFRDESIFGYRDAQDRLAYTQRILSTDGMVSWQRSCAAPADVLGGDDATCRWSPGLAVRELGIADGDRFGGWGAFTYRAAGVQVLAETVFSSDGYHAARRECPVESNGDVDPRRCSAWSYALLDHLVESASTPTML